MNLGILAWFQIENSYIVAELCENRFVEDSDCQGHCVLNKKLNDVNTDAQVVVECKLLTFVFSEASNEQPSLKPQIKWLNSGEKWNKQPFVTSLLKPPIV